MRTPICRADLLDEGEVREFEGIVRGERRPCFAVRTPDGFAAYLNVCAHRNQPVVVDDDAFDDAGLIECRAHGAKYDPSTGECVQGPCVGARLVPVQLQLDGRELWAVDQDEVDDSIYADDPEDG